MTKDQSILDLISGIQSQSIQIIDYWEGDLCAVGFWNGVDKERIAYVSTWAKDPGHYFLSLEFPNKENDDLPTKEELHDVGFSELKERIAKHLME